MRRLLLTTATLAVGLFTLAVTVDSSPASAVAATAGCSRPGGLTFTRKPGMTSGVLRWRRPHSLPANAAGYRVFRNARVVGQTRARALRVRITPGRKVTLSVRVALRSGATVPCRAAIVRRVLWRPPTTPQNVTVQEQADGVHVAWSRSRRGEGRLIGYRVFRDGVSVGQVKKPSIVIPLPPLRKAVVRVAAVDSRGKLSPLSRPTTIARGHTAPTVPGGLGAAAASDRAIDLSWSPSSGSGGVRLSYQVRRNGTVVAQTPATSLRVGNLFPASQYSFTVVAVDSLGYRSGESAPATATTMAPPQSTGGAYAFLLASTDQSFVGFQQRYGQIGTVIPTYFDCNADGSFAGSDDPLVTGWARLRGVKVHARWNCQRTATLSAILHNPSLREATIAGITGTVVANGYDGANIDFEAGAAADRSAFSSFIHDLADRLHASGKALSVDVSPKFKDVPNHPRSTFFDYDALAASADVVLVMAWGIHWSTSVPGAIDDMPWLAAVARYVAARPLRDRFVLGFGLYGIDWPAGGGTAHPGTPLEYADVTALAAKYGATPSVDPVSQAPFFRYTDSGGVPHEVWYVDAASLAKRLDLARSLGLRVGLWRLGREDPGIWGLPGLQP